MSVADWLWRIRPASYEERVNLLLLPFAGGGAHAFAPWAAHMPRDVALFGVQYPGRGPRLEVPSARTAEEIVDPLTDAILDGTDSPVAVFGHSLGALLGYEVCWKLQEAGRPVIAFVASGSLAPQRVTSIRTPLHSLNDEQLISELHRRGDVPSEVLDDRELLGFLLPVLRADFEVGEGYRYGPSARRLHCPMVVIGGDGDRSVPVQSLHAWSDVAVDQPIVWVLPGGHFYYLRQMERVTTIVGDLIRQAGLLRNVGGSIHGY